MPGEECVQFNRWSGVSKATPVMATALGRPPELEGKIPLLKTPYTLVTGHRNQAGIDQEDYFLMDSFHSAGRCYAGCMYARVWGGHQQSFPVVNPVIYNND